MTTLDTSPSLEMIGPVKGLAAFVHRLTYDRLPERVQQHAAGILLDMVGVIIWGAQDPFLNAFRTELLGAARTGPATILGTRHRCDPGQAALFNAAACTVTQIDEGHRRALGHPGIHIFPALLAIAEREGRGGKALLTALVAGYEVAVRLGEAMRPLHPGIHAHGHWPTIAAAVAGAKLLDADQATLVQAIEAAATLTLTPWTRTATDGVTAHHLYAGMGAQTAVTVAYGTRAGMTASQGTLTEYFGPRGSLAFKPERLAAGLDGDEIEFEILNNYFKFQPVCAHTITTIEAVDAIRSRLPHTATVRRVTVRTYGLAAELSDQAPRTTLAAKFSIPFVVAARLLSPDRRLQALHEQDLDDPRLHDLMRRVHVEIDPVLDREYPGARPSLVEFELDDGSSTAERRDMPPGDAENPASDEALNAKFLELTAPILGTERAATLATLCRNAAALESIRTLTDAARPLQTHGSDEQDGGK
ncbi:MAG TPA: hypothetical protein DEP84_00030 [Chloroflexi bacterium]|nr:hypothetical protein [Chloroflexota bacterium]